MIEHQSLVERLADQHLGSIEALRNLGSLFVDEISALLTQHDQKLQSFLTSQETANQARTLIR